ncbi:hypothetical protein ARSEF1564_008332 [Beauveria bassiana]
MCQKSQEEDIDNCIAVSRRTSGASALLKLSTFIRFARAEPDRFESRQQRNIGVEHDHHLRTQISPRNVVRSTPDNATPQADRDTTGDFTRIGPTEIDDARCPTVTERYNKFGGV